MIRFRLPWRKKEISITARINKDFADIENLLVVIYDFARNDECHNADFTELRLLCKVFDLSERFLKCCVNSLNKEIDDAEHKGHIVQEFKLLDAKYRLNALLGCFHETFASKFPEWENEMASVLPVAKAQRA